jgi:hypothetical protein
VQQLWNELYAAGADLVLNGHAHNYERYAPQDPSGAADPTNGIREFVVGTGGRSHHTLPATLFPNVERADDTSFGVLQLFLDPGGYTWQFAPVDGATFTDSGTRACH